MCTLLNGWNRGGGGGGQHEENPSIGAVKLELSLPSVEDCPRPIELNEQPFNHIINK